MMPTYKRHNEEEFLRAADFCISALDDCIAYIQLQIAKETGNPEVQEINHTGGIFYEYDLRMAVFKKTVAVDDKGSLVWWKATTALRREQARRRIAALLVWATAWMGGEARNMRKRDADLSNVHGNDIYYTSPSIDYPTPEPLPGEEPYKDDQ